MGCERKTTGIYAVHFEPQMPVADCHAFNEFVDRIAELPMASRYQAMASKPMACFQAVEIWQKLKGVLSEYSLGGYWFNTNHQVEDYYGFSESGQNMLKVQLPRSGNLLVADVAGYLFGFPYEQMLIAAGSISYVATQVTQHYSQKYPGIVLSPAGR